jgi:hypothetical protein
MNPILRACIKWLRSNGRPTMMWLAGLILLALLSLSLFYQQRMGKFSSHPDIQSTSQARQALVASGKQAELAAILDQSMVLVPEGVFIRGSNHYRRDTGMPGRITWLSTS